MSLKSSPEKLAYAKKWREDNPEKVAAGIARYSEKRKQKWAEFLETERAKYHANAAEMCERKRGYRQAHPERRAKTVKEYAARNPELTRIHQAERRARKRQAMPNWADRSAIAKVYSDAQDKTASTGIPHEVDHIVPLKGKNVCGLHVHWNLQVLPKSENRKKAAKWPS